MSSVPMVKLADVTTRIGSGITPRGGSSVYTPTGRPFVRSQNIGWGDLRLRDLAFIDDETHDTFRASQIQEGDVLLNITGASIGRSAVATHALDGGNVNQHVCEIRLKASMNPQFVSAMLNSQIGQDQIDAFQAGGNRQGLNFQQVGSIRVPLVPIQEQKAIASALNQVDNLVSSLRDLIAKKRAVKQGMMQELLTGRTRLPGFDGEWTHGQLGSLYDRHVGSVDPRKLRDTTFQHFSIPAFDASERPELEPGSAIDSMKFTVPRDSVLLSKLNPRIPRVWAPAKILPHAIASTEFIVAIPKQGIDRSFLKWLFKSDGVCGKMNLLATGTTKSHVRIRPTTIARLEVAWPKRNEQIAIASALDDADAEIAALERRLESARAIKLGMMQELLTGRTRLPVKEDGE